MPRVYTDEVDLIEQRLQDLANALFLAADINYSVEEALKEYGTYQKHENLVPVIFKIESRTGACSATSSSNLTDTTKTQFVSGDATDEKVIHNTTDDTWAVVSSFTSTSILALNKDIFVSGEQYEIYNKRCWNNKQIYIGDVVDRLRVVLDQIEYKGRYHTAKEIGRDILKLNIESIDDSNPTLSTLGSVDVLVWFAKPHILSQLTDWAGEVNNGAGYAAGSTSMAINGMGSTEVIEEGEIFTLENHRSYYTITADVTTSGNAATISFYPGLEAAVVDDDDITFIKSTLLPDDEDNLAELVVAKLLINKSPKFIRSGRGMSQNYVSLGERKLAQLQAKLRGQTGARTAYHHSRF